MLTYASILEKPQYYIHKGQKYLMPRSEIIDAAIAALRHCAVTSHTRPNRAAPDVSTPARRPPE
jgi:hypothetical protein